MVNRFLGNYSRYVVWFFCVAVFFALSHEFAHGAVGINGQLPFYGTLNDSDGEPLTGSYDMVYKIYDAPTGGSVLWTGTHTSANGNAVAVEDGEFSVMLGSGTGNMLTLDFNDDTYYLGVTIGTDPEMTPRERLGAAGYAVNADMLDGLHASSFLQQNTPFSINLESEAPLISLTGDADDALLTITQSGGGNFINLYDEGNSELFSVDSLGKLYATGIEITTGGVSTFNGSLEILSGGNSLFSGNIEFGVGSGLIFGEGDGLRLYQDAGEEGGKNIIHIEPNGAGWGDNLVNIVVPGMLKLTSSMSELSLDGDMVEITNGNLAITSGELEVIGGGITSELDIEITDSMSTFRASSLAGGPFTLESDVNGNIIANPSDERLKQNIQTIDDALEMVLNLRGVRYEWKDAERFGSQTEVGFIAQEVQEVIPEVVRDNGEYLSLNTKNIVAVVVEAMKELYGRVEDYFARTERLEREVEALRHEIDLLKGDTSEVPEAVPESIPDEDTETEPIPEPLPEEEVVVPDTSPSEIPPEV